MSAIGTLKEWGRLPSEFGMCAPGEDLAVMMAYDGARACMKAWEDELQRKEIEKANRKGRG